MYLSQHAKYICFILTNYFVSNYKTYLSQIGKCICLKLQNMFVSDCKMYCKIYLSQITKHICLKLTNVFVWNCIYLKLHNVQYICPLIFICSYIIVNGIKTKFRLILKFRSSSGHFTFWPFYLLPATKKPPKPKKLQSSHDQLNSDNRSKTNVYSTSFGGCWREKVVSVFIFGRS